MTAVALAYDEFGGGPPLLLLHGLFGSARNWQSYARELATTYHVVAADLRNHGRSPHTLTHDYDNLADDIAALIARLGLHRPTLLGHSMGGKAAMTLALRAPDLVAALIVVDIAPVAYPDQHTPIIDAMLALPLENVRRRQDVERALAASIPDTAVRLFLAQNLVFDAHGTHWRLNLPTLRDAMPGLVGALPVPVTARYAGPVHVIRGGRSERVRNAELAVFAQYFPRFTLHTVLHGGHWPHAEAPEEFRACLAAALASDST